VKTWFDDDGTLDELRGDMRELHEDLADEGIKEGLRNCAVAVGNRAVGEYLKGPKPDRLRARVGYNTGYAGYQRSGGGRLGRSLLIGGSMSGGGFEALMRGKGGDTIFEYKAVGRDSVDLEFGTRVPYGAIWEHGSPDRTIRPKRKKVLRWVDEFGKEHFAKEVRLRGTGRRQFLSPALDDEEGGFGDIMEDSCGAVIKKHGAA